MKTLGSLLLLIALAGCGLKFGYRHFTGPVMPVAIADDNYLVGDDRSITFVKDRLEVAMLPMSSEALNRQFAGVSEAPAGFTLPNPYAVATNPYTYGDWTPPGEAEAPTRFTVFLSQSQKLRLSQGSPKSSQHRIDRP